MKSTELRVGNLVSVDGKNLPVTQIFEKGLNCGNVGALYELVKPIPITEEWLERFGFEIKTGAWGKSAEIRIGRVRYVLYQNSDVWSINSIDGFRVDFKYIHTVQNHYFALTGEELNQNKEDGNSTDNFNSNSVPSV